MTVAVEHHTRAVKDVRLHYVVAGAGEPVVLLHGWPQSWGSWRGVIERLAPHYTVIAPDLRGMGLSSKAPGGYDTDNVADDVHELVRALGHEQVSIVGHDWGGATAYAYAAQFRDEVRRLAILEMVLPGFDMMEGAMVPRPGGEFLWHMGFQTVPDMPQALIEGREELYVRWFFQHYAYDPSAIGDDVAAEHARAMSDVGALRAGLGYYTSYFTSAEQNQVHAKQPLEMPVMAWGGEACLGDLPRQCLQLAASDVRGGVIERCGHWVGEERPDFVADELLAFLAQDARSQVQVA